MSRLSDPAAARAPDLPRTGPTLVFVVRGMDCVEEVGVLKREVGPLVGGEGCLSFDLLADRMIVQPAGAADPRAIEDAVAAAGMEAGTHPPNGRGARGPGTCPDLTAGHS